jgi:hypothetical protein
MARWRPRAPRGLLLSISTSPSPLPPRAPATRGWRGCLEDGPLDYVQFIDGDCALQPGWIDTAKAFLDENPQAAVVHGRRRERYPEATVYNQLCDWEWDRPAGQAKSCGGDAMMRLAAFQAVGGYDPGLIAGEEPELCVRLRAAGWQIWCLDAEMTLHDAAMTRFGQYWKRAQRAGHAYAEGAAMHGAPPERHGVAGRNRALIWGAGLPVAILVAGPDLALGVSGRSDLPRAGDPPCADPRSHRARGLDPGPVPDGREISAGPRGHRLCARPPARAAWRADRVQIGIAQAIGPVSPRIRLADATGSL